MIRFALAAVVLIAAVGTPAARSQDADEVKRLKDRIEVLETKLKLAEKANELLKKELQALKSGAGAQASAGFAAGTKLVGTVTRSAVANGRQVVLGNDVELEVTKRSGKEFTAEVWADNRKVGYQVEGTIKGGVVKFKSTKWLTDQNVSIVGLHSFTGRFKNGILTGRTTKKGDASYRGVWRLKLNMN